MPRVDCDTDYDELFEGWMERVIPAVSDAVAGRGADSTSGATEASITAEAQIEATGGIASGSTTVASPLALHPAVVTRNINLNGAGSQKHTRHVELRDETGQLGYDVGDRIALHPTNDPVVVDQLLVALGLAADAGVERDAASMSLRHALLSRCELTTCTRELAGLVGSRTNEPDLVAAAQANPARWRTFCGEHDAIDLLEGHRPQGVSAQGLVDALEPLGTRMYSIASSPNAHPGHVHMTVDVLQYERNGRVRRGVASSFLAERCPVGTSIDCVISKAPHFRLPQDDADIIMIGPGTGVAPVSWVFGRTGREERDRSQLAVLRLSARRDGLPLRWRVSFGASERPAHASRARVFSRPTRACVRATSHVGSSGRTAALA